jgi:hypothetical protein
VHAPIRALGTRRTQVVGAYQRITAIAREQDALLRAIGRDSAR